MQINIRMVRKLIECLSAHIAGSARSNASDKAVFFLDSPNTWS